ncbi:MAG: hypothetical protein H0X63_02345 [Flavobacteriales bacterium]|jgi:glutaredoxin-related protein|nr:hypothetical protein [Flavobacteriales bacterium]
MKNTLLILIPILLMSYTGNIQNDKIEFLEVRSNNLLEFKVINHSILPYETELKIINLKGLRGNRTPVTKTVQPKDTVTFYSFTTSGANSYNYHIKTKPIIEFIPFVEIQEVQSDNGITVFYNKNCPRSVRTVAHLLENDKDFKVIDIMANRENHDFMYQVLKDKSEFKEKFLLPVILVDGLVFFDIDIPVDFQKIFN